MKSNFFKNTESNIAKVGEALHRREPSYTMTQTSQSGGSMSSSQSSGGGANARVTAGGVSAGSGKVKHFFNRAPLSKY